VPLHLLGTLKLSFVFCSESLKQWEPISTALIEMVSKIPGRLLDFQTGPDGFFQS